MRFARSPTVDVQQQRRPRILMFRHCDGASSQAASRPAVASPSTHTGPQVERAIAWVASQGGRRLNLRYLGVDKNDFWLQMRIGVLNLRRLLALGLTHHAGSWTMA